MPFKHWYAVSLLATFWLPTLAFGGEKFLFVKENHLSCSKEHAAALEAILDAQDAEGREVAVKKAIFGGRCLWSTVAFEVVDLVSRRTPGGVTYSCFRQLDLVDRSDAGMHCSPESFVTSIQAEIPRRKGDYLILGEGPGGLKAKCVEGGIVMLMKNEEKWERFSLVFPKRLRSPSRTVPRDQERAIREGCRGLDYQ